MDTSSSRDSTQVLSHRDCIYFPGESDKLYWLFIQRSTFSSICFVLYIALFMKQILCIFSLLLFVICMYYIYRQFFFLELRKNINAISLGFFMEGVLFWTLIDFLSLWHDFMVIRPLCKKLLAFWKIKFYWIIFPPFIA